MARARESAELAAVRWRKLALLQDAYPEFVPFLHDMMGELGFSTSEIQSEIGEFLENGPDYLMIQAQRGQAKTTITAIYAVWWLIHHPQDLDNGRPAARVLIVSAGGTQANEISTLIVNLIMTVDILECLRPDKSAGDRTSVEHFDIHHSLKGIDKSPSVACVGITSNLQGKRADLLIADDVESLKNSATAVMRAQLLQVTRDFTSINTDGRIVYLGTPQSVDSIYNSLPQRGFTVRIWPGRYPTPDQVKHYGDSLAPSIRSRLEADPALAAGYGLDGKQGAPTDTRIGESILVAKELDQGPAFFQLQHMLLTALTDALRYPLKPENLVAMNLSAERYPLTVVRGFGGVALKEFTVLTKKYHLGLPHELSPETAPLTSTLMYIDPAGGGLNADETAWAFGGLLNSSIYLKDVDGIPGGYDGDKMNRIVDAILRYRPMAVKIEKNMGFGAFREVLLPILKVACEKAGWPMPPIYDDLVVGQKETRIIATLEPVIGRGALIVDDQLPEREQISLARYEARIRDTYSFFFQLSKLTRDRNSLIHDDRLDAAEGLVRHYAPALAVEQNKIIQAAEAKAMAAWVANPLGYPAHVIRTPQRASGVFARIRRL